MAKLMRALLAVVAVAALASQAVAQPPDRRPDGPNRDRPRGTGSSDIVERLMAFDKNKDGKLTREEITDERLLRLFDRADTNKDGVVTKDELTALAKKMAEEQGADDEDRPGPGRGPDRRGPRGPGARGPGGPDDDGPSGPGAGGPGGRGPGGPGGGPGRGPGGLGPPRPGTILPGFLQDRLNLTREQKKLLDELQKDVDARLAKILTDEQKKQLEEMRDRFGRGGRGGPGGPDGRGPGSRGPDGPPGGPPPRGPRDGGPEAPPPER